VCVCDWIIFFFFFFIVVVVVVIIILFILIIIIFLDDARSLSNDVANAIRETFSVHNVFKLV
jgi:hypothetical protein